MLPDRVSNPGPLTYESGALPNALRGPATIVFSEFLCSIFRVFVDIDYFLSKSKHFIPTDKIVNTGVFLK